MSRSGCSTLCGINWLGRVGRLSSYRHKPSNFAVCVPFFVIMLCEEWFVLDVGKHLSKCGMIYFPYFSVIHQSWLHGLDPLRSLGHRKDNKFDYHVLQNLYSVVQKRLTISAICGNKVRHGFGRTLHVSSRLLVVLKVRMVATWQEDINVLLAWNTSEPKYLYA
jgi:hypothetical protein